MWAHQGDQPRFRPERIAKRPRLEGELDARQSPQPISMPTTYKSGRYWLGCVKLPKKV